MKIIPVMRILLLHIVALATAVFMGCSEPTRDALIPAEGSGGGGARPEEQSNESASIDWPYWRGPEYNGVSRETGLIDDWDPAGGPGSNVLWKRADLGGRSTPIVLDGRLYTLVRAEPGTPREGEKIVCANAQTGETIWEQRFNVYLSDVPDTRVGWSSVTGDPETGRVYALGVCGLFHCFEGDSGEVVWRVPLHEKFGLLSTYGGRTNVPVICEDLVIISAIVIGWGEMAKPAHRFLGLDKTTGQVVWFSGTRLLPYDTTYSSPTLTVLAGQKALVFGSGDGSIWAFQPRTGASIWKYDFSRRGLNVSPLVVGDHVYSSHSEENIVGNTMGAIVAIDASGHGDVTHTHELWFNAEIMAGKSSPIHVDGRLYCFDDRGKLHVLDGATGERIGRKITLGTVMRASPLYADGKIYAATANGRWVILQPDEKRGARILRKGRLPSGEECHASPICSGGRIYFQSTGHMYCLQDKNKPHGIDEAPAAPAEDPVERDLQPIRVQLVPSEVLMMSGQSRQFSVRLFNQKGQRLPDAQATYTVEGPADISPTGQLDAANDAGHAVATVRAQVGELTGKARIRIVPPLPWEFDFEDIQLNSSTGRGQPPATWVGARYRHVVREDDGNRVMVKVTTIPKGTRSRCWFGPPELSNYTIQADVLGTQSSGKLPDIGMIAQGYALDLQGDKQRLQIRSWVPQLRMATHAEFSWQPDTWYTMKLRAAVTNGQAILKGKIWRRDQPEPESWTVEATDEAPNTSGSPGLFGNAKDAELLLDNIRVTSNVP